MSHVRHTEPYSVDPVTDCWNWERATNPQTGYGITHVNREAHLAHRVMYETHVGVIPDGLQLDHLCRNRKCVNPAHLEPVTSAENTRRALQYLNRKPSNACIDCGSSIARRALRCRSCEAKRRIDANRTSIANPNPTGYCECGCGQRTEIATSTKADRGWVNGCPKRFIHGHQSRRSVQ